MDGSLIDSQARIGFSSWPAHEALPPDAAPLVEAGRHASFFASGGWFRIMNEHGRQPESEPMFVLGRLDDAPVLLLPMLAERRLLSAFTNPYTCLFLPLLAERLASEDIKTLGRGLAQYLRRWPVVRLDSLPSDDPRLDELVAGLREGGRAIRSFPHFGNWYEKVGGLSWSTYLANREPLLRETIRRRTRRLERTPGYSLQVVRGPSEVEQAIAAYEHVYARSWKQPEPFPRFNPALIRFAAETGALRLGLCSCGDQPVAAQLWIVQNGCAAILKLAHDEAFKPLSPGTVLTARMIRMFLDEEHVTEIDFGRGDDPYKQGWARERRQRIGLMVLEPWHPSGLSVVAQHAAGTLRRRLWRRVQRDVGRPSASAEQA